MSKESSWQTVLGLIGHWLIMVAGALLYIAIRRVLNFDSSFNWHLWGDLVLFGTLVDFLVWNYSRPKTDSNGSGRS
ncbi:hypothetical protein C3E79_06610 [Corynebacterium liangguodongii]|uniref:Uncharacterized protein n=1 Tax=Corynebacterium liangguodongii TaxID=2079535 RepID=A0A2S0WEJ4_9CORY|nr:hypothetical protein C3E79_06610 [Corynebacterium liangguodongii]